MRYAVAHYTSDLTNPNRPFIPVGVLVVNEEAKNYVFRFLSAEKLPEEYKPKDPYAVQIWNSFPDALRQKFLEYNENPQHEYYVQRMGKENYQAFISQVIWDWSLSSFVFSSSHPVKKEGTLEEIAEESFKTEVMTNYS